MGFLYPDNWWVIFLITGLVILIGLLHKSRIKIISIFFTKDLLTPFLKLKLVLLITGFVCCGFALLGPYSNLTESISVRQKQIYFLLDASASMNVRDVSPSRIEYAKLLIEQCLEKLKGEQVALITFTNLPYVSCPLTRDFDMFKLQLSLVQSGQFKHTGTNFRKLFLKLLEVLESHEKDAGQQQFRCAVLLTDGENFGEKYYSQLYKLKQIGVPILPVGIGTVEGGRVPAFTQDGYVDYQTPMRRGYGSIESKLEITELETIGETFGIKPINGNNLSASQLVQEINQLVSVIDTPYATTLKQNQSLYQIFLGLGLTLIITAFFIKPMNQPLDQKLRQYPLFKHFAD